MSDFNLDWINYYLDKRPKVIFDIGCFDCSESLQFKRRFPQTDIYAFEASPKNYNRIITNPNITSQVRVFNMALCDKIGEIDFHDSYGVNECSGSILESCHTREDLKFHSAVKVPATTISHFCATQGIPNVDVIHMDVQGAEYYVMKGIGEIRPEIIFCETAEYDNYKGALTMEDLDDLMTDLGYRIEKALEFDTLYVKKENVRTSLP
jgi:FkbM family methyltransferase